MRRRRPAEHPCSLPATRQDLEGFLWACTCGRVWVMREDWHLWDRITRWDRFKGAR